MRHICNLSPAAREPLRGDARKHDGDKPMWDLLPLDALAQVVAVLTYGASKYGPHSWLHVKDAEDRYFAALMRHLYAHRMGEHIDSETGLPHLAHAACNALFLLAGNLRGWSDDK